MNAKNDIQIGDKTYAWYWSVPWLAAHHKHVPPVVILQGIEALKLEPRIVADGALMYDADAYARLQQWLISQADQQLAGEKEKVASE